MASLFWALWDEAYGQRPWKTYQKEWQQRYTAFLNTAKSSSGKSLKEVAAELSISAKTVGTYHTRLLEKMSMNSDVELTRYALANKLVD